MLIEEFAKDQIYVDFGSELMFGDDQAYNAYPVRFPVVEFELMATDGLVQIADRFRMEKGYRPSKPMDAFKEEDCDNSCWYNFYISINGYTQSRIDNSIVFVVVNSDQDDDESMYALDLSEDEQTVIYNRLDEQCRKYLNKSCEELLAEAEEKMMGRIKAEGEVDAEHTDGKGCA